jgi:hypothetical protein
MRIAFGYHSRVGKDLAVKYLMNKYPNSKELRFANKLYEVLYKTQEILGEPKTKVPYLLQNFADILKHQYGDDIFINAELKELNEDLFENYFVSDLRFKNEYKKLKELGFITIKINRDARIIDRNQDHPSEKELEDQEFDYEIDNNGSIEDFYREIDAILKMIKNIN